MISLVLEYKRMLKEVGDLVNIIPYEFKKTNSNKYEFKTNDNLNILVLFSPYDKDDCEELNIDFPAYNISYYVEGIETQFKKTDYNYLMKIIKTIFNISLDWIKSNPNINNITILAANKNKDKFLSQTDPQKDKLYKSIIISNLNKFPGDWNFKRLDIDKDYNRLLIYKK